MRFVRSAVLYTGLILTANATLADQAVLEALRQGTMRALAVATEPVAVPEAVLIDETDAERSLAEYRGRYILLNFWATWCAPCREEMPSLDRLQAELGGDRFAVVTVAVGRNPVPAINRFFDEQGIANLPKLRDPKQQLAGAMGARGLPVTVLVDPEGREIARLTGPAEWDSPEAKALIAAVVGEGG